MTSVLRLSTHISLRTPDSSDSCGYGRSYCGLPNVRNPYTGLS